MAALGAGWRFIQGAHRHVRHSPAQNHQLATREAIQQALRVFRDTEWNMASRVSVTDTESVVPDARSMAALADLRRVWPQVLDAAKRRSRTLWAFLLEATPVAVGVGHVVMGVRYQFHLNNLNEARYRDLVEDILGELTGEAWCVHFGLGTTV
jgi:hypothetical protein